MQLCNLCHLRICTNCSPTNLTLLTSSVRRILKRGGARNFRKFERNIDQNLKLWHSNFVPFFAQNQVISSPKPDAQLAKEGAMPQFCSLFYAILQSWRPKGGAMAQWLPLNTSLLLILLISNPIAAWVIHSLFCFSLCVLVFAFL